MKKLLFATSFTLIISTQALSMNEEKIEIQGFPLHSELKTLDDGSFLVTVISQAPVQEDLVMRGSAIAIEKCIQDNGKLPEDIKRHTKVSKSEITFKCVPATKKNIQTFEYMFKDYCDENRFNKGISSYCKKLLMSLLSLK